jgi:flagellar biosynthesis protein FlhF
MEDVLAHARPVQYEATTVRAALARIARELGPDAQVVEIGESPDGAARVMAVAGGGADHDIRPRAGLLRALERSGLSERLIARWTAALDRADAGVEEAVASAMAEDVAFTRLPDLSVWERPIMLVGAPGAGKTSAAARLAIRARLQDRRVVLITLDGGKSGGLDQAQELAGPLGVDVVVARAPAELPQILARVPQGVLPVIDSTGQLLFGDDSFEVVAAAARLVGARTLLVHAAGGAAEENIEIAETARAAGIDAWLVTKLDAVRRLGSVITAAATAGLALAGGTRSPWVADGFVDMDARAAIGMLIHPPALRSG